MSIKQQLQDAMKSAMRNKSKLSLSNIRMIIDRIQKKEKDLLRELSEEEAVQVIQTFKKQINEEMDAFRTLNNLAKVEELNFSRDIVEMFLPKQMPEQEITNIIISVIEGIHNVGETPNKGAVMKKIMPLVKGKADSKLVNDIVTKLLKGHTLGGRITMKYGQYDIIDVTILSEYGDVVAELDSLLESKLNFSGSVVIKDALLDEDLLSYFGETLEDDENKVITFGEKIQKKSQLVGTGIMRSEDGEDVSYRFHIPNAILLEMEITSLAGAVSNYVWVFDSRPFNDKGDYLKFELMSGTK